MKYLMLSLLALGLSFQPGTPVVSRAVAKPKNIILLVGDGMGLAQISAGFYANGQKLELERFPVTGLMTTHSSNNLITDSAAGATAFSCGCKTYNGAIGVNAKHKKCVTILEEAEQNGLATGLVASCSVTHATPGAFIAHVNNRAEHEAIAEYYLKTDVDLVIGGGMKYFNKRSLDTRDLTSEWQQKGYQVASFETKKLSELTILPNQPLVWFGAYDEPEAANNGRDWLPFAAEMAPKFLKERSEKGFFLMLEGSQIDWACHANDGPRAVAEMLDFDRAIGKILEWATQDGETLVIVTADHETGGLALTQGASADSLDLHFNSTSHTASLVPVFAYGPGAEQFGGIIDNTDIYVKIKGLFGF
jgi:alkaline phosphatase